jgi:RNA polymerase sigma-70 factor (ECF subfamily)
MGERRVEAYDIQRLVEAAGEGDRSAFGELAAHFQHEVYTLAVRLVSDRTLAADVAQEALVRAWRGLSCFRGDAAFSTWLHRITVNTAWSQLNRVKRHRSQPLEEASGAPDLRPENDPQLAGEAALVRDRIGQALRQLPAAQRSVIVLKDIYGWSHKEIAEQLSITVTASKVRLHRGHQRLREILGGER